MVRKEAIGAGALAVVLAFGLSGCFVFRELQWSDDKPKPGDKVTAKFSLTATIEETTAALARGKSPPEYAFFQLSFQTEDPEPKPRRGPEPDFLKFVNGGKFDTTSQFDGPTQLEKSDQLAARLVEEELNCAAAANAAAARAELRGMIPEPSSTIVAADEMVFDNERKVIEAKAPVKVSSDTPKSVQSIVLASGGWVDDGDGDPEDSESSDDSYSCGFLQTSTLIVK